MEFSSAVDQFVGLTSRKRSIHTRGLRRRGLFLYYNRHELPGNPNTLKWIIGEDPLGFHEWAARQGGSQDFSQVKTSAQRVAIYKHGLQYRD